jgi:hypothetical protein
MTSMSKDKGNDLLTEGLSQTVVTSKAQSGLPEQDWLDELLADYKIALNTARTRYAHVPEVETEVANKAIKEAILTHEIEMLERLLNHQQSYITDVFPQSDRRSVEAVPIETILTEINKLKGGK